MPNNQKYRCLAVYLYYNEPWESFLSEAVFPYIKTTLKTGIATHYFFIRYWEKGPHIRLRFFGEPSMLEEVLQPNLTEHFQTYFDSKPSHRKEPHYTDDVPEHVRWAPNNSIEFVAYQPEWKRYGGPRGLAMAEQHFQSSSQVVLQMISSRAKSWTYEDALGTAIKLHLGFAQAVGMSTREARSFFHFFFYNWLPRSVQRPDPDNAALLGNLEAFETAYATQRSSLVPFHRQLWDALQEKQTFDEAAFNRWISANQELHRQFVALQTKGVLEPRPRTYQYNFWPESTAKSPEDRERWMHFADYLHMTNNRLGILNRDEGYLGFLMMRCMESL